MGLLVVWLPVELMLAARPPSGCWLRLHRGRVTTRRVLLGSQCYT